jgi:hypothetical protein
MIYIGDGITDIPSMTLIGEKGDKAIAIDPSGAKTKAKEKEEKQLAAYLKASEE